MYSDEFNAPEFKFLWPVEPALKCIYQDAHPGVSMETINTFMKVDTVNAPSMIGKPSIVLDFNYDYNAYECGPRPTSISTESK